MFLLESEKIPMGSEAKDFSLLATDEKKYSLEDFKDFEVLVIVFMCNHCPYVQKIWGDLVRIQSEFENRGVRFVGINPNFHPDYPEETMDKMNEYYETYEMNFPYLLDREQSVAKSYNAQCTPDIYVYDSERKLGYHGRVEDGELEKAIESLINGQMPSEEQNPSIGCSIKWRD